MTAPSTTDGALSECAVGHICGGCPWIGRPPAQQTAERRATFMRRIVGAANARVRMAALPGVLRDRLEVRIDRGVVGMMERRREDAAPTFLRIDDCPAATGELRAFLRDLIADPPPLARASVRLRVDLDGRRGLWLDADRADLEALCEPGNAGFAWLLRNLTGSTSRAPITIELGQRRQAFVIGSNGAPTIEKAVPGKWFQTWCGDRTVPLWVHVADFTQPSRIGNRQLLKHVMAFAESTGLGSWVELGAGAGHMTLPFVARGWRVRAVELDVSALRFNLDKARRLAEGSKDKVLRRLGSNLSLCEPRAGSLGHAREVGAWMLGHDGVLADPPRSGLGAFGDALGLLSPALRPKAIIYVSCWLDALVGDAETLVRHGYRLEQAVGVEQFIDSPEVEWVTLWRPQV